MKSTQSQFLSLSRIESKVCDIAAEQMGFKRTQIFPESRLIEDLHCDSLDMVELVMEIEDEFEIALPDAPPHLAYKQVFTRSPFRLRDLAELVYLQQGSGKIRQKGGWWQVKPPLPERAVIPFLQLGGRASTDQYSGGNLYSNIGQNSKGFEIFRRSTDGMPCIQIPAAIVTIGSNQGNPDEQPVHAVQLQSFLIDQEPVSTTAYCPFLNSIGPVNQTLLQSWCLLAPDDNRKAHVLLRHDGVHWSPLPGTERFPMILVSWHGAAAYARWANRHDWRPRNGESADDDGAFLPFEAQWEYAARGALPKEFPWGDDPATQQLMRFAQHQRGATYAPETLPLANVNEPLGVSPFGLVHMAGNVWQWCRDWYSSDGYQTDQAPDQQNTLPTGIKSERGGSWIGPAFLCRSSYRRGRVPTAKGRCLGFRCIGA